MSKVTVLYYEEMPSWGYNGYFPSFWKDGYEVKKINNQWYKIYSLKEREDVSR